MNFPCWGQTYLYTHQKRSIGSFHDEMLMRQKQVEEKNLRKQIDLKEREVSETTFIVFFM